MERRRWLRGVILICFISLCVARELDVKSKYALPIYNHTLATILVEYSSAVYMSDLTELFTWTCERCNGLTKGFEMIELIVDVQACLQAFVGVAKDLNAIVIAFRGTQESSIQNWIEDLYWKQLDCNYPGTTDAMVHHGFYSAYHNTTVRPGILSAVKSAKELYGDLQIMVTGHSMGGAMAAFCGLDLRLLENSEILSNTCFIQQQVQTEPLYNLEDLIIQHYIDSDLSNSRGHLLNLNHSFSIIKISERADNLNTE